MGRNPAFDGIRALAALMIVARHCNVPGFDGGSFGVNVFLVLSGFLITTLLRDEIVRTGGIDFRLFYVRRLLRLGPPLMMMLAAYVALAPWLLPEFTAAEHFRDAALTGLYLTDYSRAFWDIPNIPLTHTWSLSLEEHYYLIWPVVLLLLMTRGDRRHLLVLAALYVVATEWRLLNIPFTEDRSPVYFRLDTRMSELILGGLLAFAVANGLRLKAWLSDAVGLCGIAGLFVCVATFRSTELPFFTWGIVLAEWSAAGLILAVVNREAWLHKALAWSPLVYLGLISYGIYLWHNPIVEVLRPFLDWPLLFAAVALMSIAAASGSWFWLERPMYRLRHSLGRPVARLA